ncbi:hypothetical protein BDF20DRAFT_916347 [Mycotypha africana]|uniref:uncharacterized protein n=1 Tax=Mycotypha africana TaxID=64632 RepID=UPI002301B045|nr:uncharacterized protein BDF20DRAFT_916347 [Mycotypha africana]KAI8968912.1 hypothetical protein BDF20DRAFT_916347 [Mycotypha africana]
MKNSSASEKDTKFDDSLTETLDEKTKLTAAAEQTDNSVANNKEEDNKDKEIDIPAGHHSAEMEHIFNQFSKSEDVNKQIINDDMTKSNEARRDSLPSNELQQNINDTLHTQQMQQEPQQEQVTPFEFNRFLEQMKSKSAKPITRYFKSFLQAFERRPWTVNEQIKIVQDFLDFIYAKMRECDVWKDLTQQEFENAKEGMEKLVMNRLYHATFSPSTTDDKERDEILYLKISIFRWIREKHLDIPDTEHNESFLTFAESELLKINNFKAPRDKLICILNSCKVIFGLIKHVEGDAGADKFLPILIYVILRANPPRLVSNVQYIYRFRSPEQLQAEAGYYLTNLMGAISFIETMDATSLSISKEEFDRNIERTMTELKQERPSVTLDKQQVNYENALHPTRFSTAFQQQQQQQEQQQHHHYQHHHLLQPSPPLIDAAKAAALLEKGSQFAQKTMQRPLNFVGKIFQGLGDTSSNNSRTGSPNNEDEENHLRDSLSQPYNPYQPHYASASSYSPPSLPTRDHQRQTLAVQPEVQPPTLPPRPPHDQMMARRNQQLEANLEILNSMFSNIDSSVCHLVLHANGGDLTKSIDNLLEMSGNDPFSIDENAHHEQLPTSTSSTSLPFSAIQQQPAPVVPPKNSQF